MNRNRTLQVTYLIIFISLLICNCASPPSRSEKEVHFGEAGSQNANQVTQAEIQQDLQRFTVGFLERVGQAYNALQKSKSPIVREEGARCTLRYATAALDIATEPSPELGLLDMLVFMTLSRDTLTHYWVPYLFKQDGKIMEIAFARSEPEIWAIADKVMTPKAQEALKQLIVRWKKENLGQIRVEGVRLSDFSKRAGKIAQERADSTGGLLSNVTSGVVVADEALLMAERVLFLSQRIPFLIRLHASLGVGELITAFDSKLETLDLSKTAQEAKSVTALAGQAAHEGTLFAQSLYPLVLPLKNKMSAYLSSANALASKSITILDTLNSSSPAAIQRIDNLITKIFSYFFFMCASLFVIWWTGYFYVRKRLMIIQANKTTQKIEKKEAA